jgi:type IV pilus assembly protein PilP
MVKTSLVALSLGLLLAGCSDRAPAPVPVASRPAAVAAAPTLAAAPESERVEPQASYSYNPVGKPDPFRNPLNDICCELPPPSLCNEPLCRYELEQLKLSGVISGLANPVAVVESPQGKSYSIYQGSKVGRNGGVVKQVLRDSLVVAEAIQDDQGRTSVHETILRMPSDPPVALEE